MNKRMPAKIHNKLSSKIKKLPGTPGVYMFLNGKGRIIYVGKARVLKKRVMSYFRAGRAGDARLELLRGEIRDINFVRASSEAEALIYEAGLIKDHRPKYNIELKDDKSYPFLKLTMNEEYPRLFITRRRVNDGAVYYGPYTDVKLLKQAVSFMKKVFPLRTCKKFHKTVCLEYHIGQCLGPCEGKTSKQEYGKIVKQLKAFLEGRKEDLIDSLNGQMKRLSEKRKYEKALIIKKRVEALTAVQQMHDRAQYPMFGELDELRNALGLKKIPAVIECFDISNIGGKEAVGSMVRFVDGRPDKGNYRKFRIRTVGRIDDYSMIREVVRRRYSRLLGERKKLPDLVLIDGGKGHLMVAKDELAALGVERTALASIAKEHDHLYTLKRPHPIRLSPGSRLLLLIQRVRDEAHRFAIEFHRSLRMRAKFYTELRDIKGIGPVKEDLLLEKFKSIERIKKLSLKDLIEAGIDVKTSKAIIEYFKK